jgi:succinate dehydrogenase / fumarate reductase cytochrome b subunit
VPAALSGLALVLFLLVHLVGVSLAPLAPQRFEAWAAALHRSVWLPGLELTLLAVALLHLAFSLVKRLSNRSAGNTAVLTSRRRGPLAPLAAFAARQQAWAGGLLLVFLGVHLRQLRLPRPAIGDELATLQAALRSPLSLGLYLAAAAALALHLFHGAEAAHRSLGLLDPRNGGRIRTAGRLLAALLGGGFALVAALLAWGVWVGPALPGGTP